jgi:hypothetical protein
VPVSVDVDVMVGVEVMVAVKIIGVALGMTIDDGITVGTGLDGREGNTLFHNSQLINANNPSPAIPPNP